MKKTVFTIDNQEIAFSKTFFGKERLYLNGKQVSKKFSFGGTTHRFSAENTDFEVKSVYNTFNLKNIELQLKKDRKRIDSVTVEMKNVLIAETSLQAFIGIATYRLLEYSLQYV